MTTDGPLAADHAVPALELEAVEKRFGRSTVLAGVSLSVRTGESFALAGLNGASKTTLIKCLLDFCATDGGRIRVFGVDHGLTASRARIAFLPERFMPPYYLTGRDFLRYMLKLQGVAYRESEAEEMLRSLDLELSALIKPVRAFSKGMTQKLGLAACFLAAKDLYILDEPTSGLDPRARALLKQRLRGLRERGHSVFFTSHSLADVEEISDRLAVIDRGRLRFCGTPGALRAQRGGTLEEAFLACLGSADRT